MKTIIALFFAMASASFAQSIAFTIPASAALEPPLGGLYMGGDQYQILGTAVPTSGGTVTSITIQIDGGSCGSCMPVSTGTTWQVQFDATIGASPLPGTAHTLRAIMADSMGGTAQTSLYNVVFVSSIADCSVSVVATGVTCQEQTSGGQTAGTIGPTASTTQTANGGTGSFLDGDTFLVTNAFLRPASPYQLFGWGGAAPMTATDTTVTPFGLASYTTYTAATTTGVGLVTLSSPNFYNLGQCGRSGQIISGTAFSPGTVVINCNPLNILTGGLMSDPTQITVYPPPIATTTTNAVTIGYQWPSPTSVGTVAVGGSCGTGYKAGDIATISGGNALAELMVTTVSGGCVTGVTRTATSPDKFFLASTYSDASNVATAAVIGAGSGLTVNIKAGFVATVTDQGYGPGYEKFLVTGCGSPGCNGGPWTIVRGVPGATILGAYGIAHDHGQLYAFDPGPYPAIPSYITDTAGNAWTFSHCGGTEFTDSNTVGGCFMNAKFTPTTAANAQAGVGCTPAPCDKITLTAPYSFLGQVTLNSVRYRGLGAVSAINNGQATNGWAAVDHFEKLPYNMAMTSSINIPATPKQGWAASPGDICIVAPGGSPFMPVIGGTNTVLFPPGGSGFVSASGHTLTYISGTTFNTSYNPNVTPTIATPWQPGALLTLNGVTDVHIAAVVNGSTITTIEALTTSASESYLVPDGGALPNPSTGWGVRTAGNRGMILDNVAGAGGCNGGAFVSNGDDGVGADGISFHPSGGVEQSYVTTGNNITSNSVTGPTAGVPWVLQAKIDVFPTTMSASPVIWDSRGSPGPLGAYIQLVCGSCPTPSPTQIQVNMNNETGQSATMGAFLDAAPFAGMYITVAHDAAAAGSGHSNTDTLLIWNPTTATILYTSTATYTTNTSNGSGPISIAGAASPNAVNWAFMRICTGASTTAPTTSLMLAMPTTAGGCPTGANILEWNGGPGNTTTTTLVDLSMNGHTGTVNTGTITFATTNYTGIISVIRSVPPLGAPPPYWTNQPTLRAGPGQLTASASVTECVTSNVLTYSWSNVSGPTTPTFSSTSALAPTLTLSDTTITSNDYTFRLIVGDTCGNISASSTQEIGVVTMDASGIVVPQTANEGDIFGPQIAFGQSPWAGVDQQPWSVFPVQQAFQAQYPTVGFGGQVGQGDWSWTTNAAGTVAYPASTKGFNPGSGSSPYGCGASPVPTLSTQLLSGDMTISITNGSCLSLAGLPAEPTWLLVGSSFGTWEQIRVCSVASGSITSAVVLNICYDGRWISGNLNQSSSPTTTAVTWTLGSTVGEMRVQGSSTFFLTDASRPLSPEGGPGPMGQIASSLSNVGTITLSTGSYTGSSTISGSGTAWTSAMVGNYIWLHATHSSATFNFWCQITAVASTTSLTCNRPAPAGIDSFTYSSYTVMTPIYLSLEANAPVADQHVMRLLQNGIGCESQTACFAVSFHDIPGLDGSIQPTTGSVHASYKLLLSAYQGGGFFPYFYGTGCGDNDRMFFRSGLHQWLTLASTICQNWPRDPQIGDGFAGGDPLVLGGPGISSMRYMALHPSNGVLTWKNLEQFATYSFGSLLNSGGSPASACNSLDTRETGIDMAFTGLAANYDTNSGPAATFTGYLGSLLTRQQGCMRPASQGYIGQEVNSAANTTNWSPQAGPFQLMMGSPTVTGSGFVAPGPGQTCSGVDTPTVTVMMGQSTFTYTGTLTAQNFLWIYSPPDNTVIPFTYTLGSPNRLGAIWKGTSGPYAAMSANDDIGNPSYTSIWTGNADWPTVSAAAALANNQALEKAWPCKYVNSTTLTLLRNWDAASGSSYFLTHFNIGMFSQQQFFYGGYFANAFAIASHSTNSTTALGFKGLTSLLGPWFNSYGWDPVNNHGTFYSGVWQGCASNSWTAAGSFTSISGDEGCGNNGLAPGSASVERVDSVEGGLPMLMAVANGQIARSTGDTFFGAIYAIQGLCWASVASTCSDGQFASPNPTTPGGQLGKWPGFYDAIGGGFTAGYPAVSKCVASGGTISGATCVMISSSVGVPSFPGSSVAAGKVVQ